MEPLTILHPKTGKPVTFDWDYDTPPTPDEQAAIIAQFDGPTATDGNQGTGFINKLIHNAAGVAEGAASLIPGVGQGLNLLRGEPIKAPGQALAEGMAGHLVDQFKKIPGKPVGEQMLRSFALPFEAISPISPTVTAENIQQGKWGDVGADVVTAWAAGKLGSKIGARMPARTPGVAAAVGEAAAAPKPINFDTVVPVERPFQLDVLHTLPEFLPGRVEEVAALRKQQLQDAIDSSLPIERPDPYVADQLDRVGVPVERAVNQPDELWMKALEKNMPPVINHAPLTQMREVLNDALRKGNYQYRHPTAHKQTYQPPQ